MRRISLAGGLGRRGLAGLLCAGLLAGMVPVVGADSAGVRHSPAVVMVCHNYGCAKQAAVRVDTSTLWWIDDVLQASADAAAEREALSRVLAQLYRLAARQSPVMGQPVMGPGVTPVGPNAMYGRTSPPSYQSAQATPAGQAAAAAAGLPSGRGSEVSLVSFNEGASGTGSPVPKGNTVYTDSANYLPPNSIAVAKVIVGVDAAAGVQSQTDPLPVVLRITGPARSVYDNGRLLTTNIAGCLVNGAARGDLSSEKVYVKLQRMTCPQPNGRYAVSDVKGFIAFGGKTGVRGRVVSREGSLIGQAFLAGLAGGFGRGFSANTNSILQGTNVNVNGQRQKLGPGEILQGGLGEGVATSADTVSKYLIERAEQYQPVIEMPTGIDVEIVFLEGVFING